MADDPTPDPETPPTGDPEPIPPPEPDLGDAGKKAIEAERKARRDAEKAAKAAQAELAKLREASQSEQEKALAAAKAEGRTEVLKTANERLLRAEVRAAAASKLQDPDDAIRLLDLDQFDVTEDGAVDQDAITAAIAELVQTKPYLAAGEPPAPKAGNPEAGAREPNNPQTLDEKIAEATTAGDVRAVMALNAQKLATLKPEGA